MPESSPLQPALSFWVTPANPRSRHVVTLSVTKLRAVGMLFLVWSAYGVIHGVMWRATETSAESPAWLFFTVAMLVAWGWALLTPLLFRFARRVVPARVGWLASVCSHAAMATVVAVAITSLRVALISSFTGEPHPSLNSLVERVTFWSDVMLFTYLAIIAVGSALDGHRRYLDRCLRAHVLETQLARAQLQFLELQLQPHFLFNSLNAIQELAHEAPAAAERMLRKLHTLLGLSLARSGRDEVSLDEELAALGPYVDIQRTRFSDWLTVSVAADREARAGLVPHLILQPLVENAIRHGLAVRTGPGHVQVSATLLEGRLLLTVSDNGVGFRTRVEGDRQGIGLLNVGERLRQLHGGDHRFEFHDGSAGGAVVEIDIPFRAALPAPMPTYDAATAEGSTNEAEPQWETADVASWRTGEFVAADSMQGGASSPRSAAPQTHAVEVRVPSPAPGAARGTAETAAPRLGAKAWTVFAGLWLVMTMFWTVQMYVFYRTRDKAMPLFDPGSLKLQLAGSVYWLLLSPLILMAARALRLRGDRWLLPLGFHLGTAVVVAFGHLVAMRELKLSSSPIFVPFNINPLTGNFFIYLGLVAWSHSRDFVSWYRGRELESARLAAEIALSRFQSLCVRLRPQFLLRTIDLLARLVYVDVMRAELLIARLADVLRQTLEVARAPTTTLQQELLLLSTSIEAHRIGIRRGVRLSISVDPAALGTRLPSRLLCAIVDDLLGAETLDEEAALTIAVVAERATDATRVRLTGTASWREAPAHLHAWWRKKSVAEASVAEAGGLVSVVFPDRATAVVVLADPPVVRAAGQVPVAA